MQRERRRSRRGGKKNRDKSERVMNNGAAEKDGFERTFWSGRCRTGLRGGGPLCVD